MHQRSENFLILIREKCFDTQKLDSHDKESEKDDK